MVSESVEKILKAEKDASQLIEEAHIKAAEIVEKARADAASYKASAMAGAAEKEAELEKELDIYKSQAKKELCERLENEQQRLKDIALEKMPTAANRISELILQ